MTVNPRTVAAGSMLTDAVAIMAERKISELPVIDANMLRLASRHHRSGGYDSGRTPIAAANSAVIGKPSRPSRSFGQL